MLNWKKIQRSCIICCLLSIGLTGCATKVTVAPVTGYRSGLRSKGVVHYKVRPGDTLFSIAKRTGCDMQKVARENRIPVPYKIRPGQVLQIGGGSEPRFAKRPALRKKSTDKATVVVVSPKKERILPPPGVGARKIIDWRWPTDGKLVGQFSPMRGGNKGVDFAGNRGQPIYSTASGRVVYAGDALRGYGKLVIIKHGNDYLSAYAHNDQILVCERQGVAAGQRIATMGSTGASTVSLHFEIRYKGKSVNPLCYMPPRDRLN